MTPVSGMFVSETVHDERIAMSARRLFGIGVILVLASIAWVILGGSVEFRTGDKTSYLADEVSGLWGGPQTQSVPSFSAEGGAKAPELSGSDITADFKLDQRRKGLLWYATYVVDFDATYQVKNPSDKTAKTTMTFVFPDAQGIYDGFEVKVNGKEVPVSYREGNAIATFEVAPGATAAIETGYTTNGLDDWTYAPSPAGVGIIQNFKLTMNTDFAEVDYPAGGVSPTSRERSGDGWQLVWDYDSVVSGRPIGLVMPSPANPGPLVSRITFFAPVSLLFFFAALILLTTTSKVKLHPIHYGFLAAAFFAFHLLLAYLADQVDLNLAFGIASVTSVLLVLGYLRVVVGANRALLEIAISQFVFLVLFSYSFFFEGFTGLAITIGSVFTLAFFMLKTARVDWDEVFERKPRAARSRDLLPWGTPAVPAAAPAVPPAPESGSAPSAPTTPPSDPS